LLFEIGKILIALYLGKSSVAASFGSAGPFVVLMVWVYYSTQILLFGAELTAARVRLSRGSATENPAIVGKSIVSPDDAHRHSLA
jgi:membrane protein